MNNSQVIDAEIVPTKGRQLHDKATDVLKSKGFSFVDFGSWQKTDDGNLITLSFPDHCLDVSLTSADCVNQRFLYEIVQPEKLEAQLDFVIRLLHLLDSGRVAWDDLF